jgi:protein-tyrosine phosphatase
LVAQIYWIETDGPGRLAVVGRPRSHAIFRQLKTGGIDVLVSMLEADEAAEVGLSDAAKHCEDAGIEFISVGITDHGVPASFEDMEAMASYLVRKLDGGLGVAAHCFAGLGRSPLMIATVLIQRGLSHEAAIALVSKARGYSVPEMASQHDWLYQFARRRTK